MKTWIIQISDSEFKDLGLKKSNFSISELIEIIKRRITKQALDKSVSLADAYGLSEMTMDEINDEVKAYRNAKGNS